MEPILKMVLVSRIRTDGGTQTRAGIREEVIEDYRTDIEAGSELPALVAFDDGKELWLADGFHRLAAFLRLGRTEVRVAIQKGTRQDALLYSAGANCSHG